jgi:hypothetical protein
MIPGKCRANLKGNTMNLSYHDFEDAAKAACADELGEALGPCESRRQGNTRVHFPLGALAEFRFVRLAFRCSVGARVIASLAYERSGKLSPDGVLREIRAHPRLRDWAVVYVANEPLAGGSRFDEALEIPFIQAASWALELLAEPGFPALIWNLASAFATGKSVLQAEFDELRVRNYGVPRGFLADIGRVREFREFVEARADELRR